MDLCYSGKWTRDQMYDRLIKSGGFVDLLGTSEATDVTAMIDSGNKYAELVYDAFIYQIGKEIGAMAAVLHFDVDAILLGGGIVHDKRVVDGLTQMCGKIAPIRAYPGEFEMGTLAAGALRGAPGQRSPSRPTPGSTCSRASTTSSPEAYSLVSIPGPLCALAPGGLSLLSF